MTRVAAKLIGFLIAILLLVIWIVITNNLPTSTGIGGNLIAIITAMLMGLLGYVAVVKQ